MSLDGIRRAIGIAGIALLGGALAIAPILAFDGDMGIVSGIGIAGIALLVVMRFMPRPAPDETKVPDGDDGRER